MSHKSLSHSANITSIVCTLKVNALDTGIGFLEGIIHIAASRCHIEDAPAVGDQLPILQRSARVEGDHVIGQRI